MIRAEVERGRRAVEELFRGDCMLEGSPLATVFREVRAIFPCRNTAWVFLWFYEI
jgi:hypothetical protein